MCAEIIYFNRIQLGSVNPTTSSHRMLCNLSPAYYIIGQCREFIKNIPEDGSRAEWGPVFLHARPVSTAKQQQAASGISDAPSATTAAGSATACSGAVEGGNGSPSGGTAFTSDHLHRGGFQALELIRITNITPLLWVRVDPHGLYNGRLNIFQQDACLAEQLFHDGDAAGQVEVFIPRPLLSARSSSQFCYRRQPQA